MCIQVSHDDDHNWFRDLKLSAAQKLQVSLASGDFAAAARHLDDQEGLLFSQDITVVVPEAYVIQANEFANTCNSRGIGLTINTPRLGG